MLILPPLWTEQFSWVKNLWSVTVGTASQNVEGVVTSVFGFRKFHRKREKKERYEVNIFLGMHCCTYTWMNNG
jgi:hypothetical protein